MIGYNALTAFGSPSYYVQKMFYNNKGDVVLPISLTPQIRASNRAGNRQVGEAAGGLGGRGRGPARRRRRCLPPRREMRPRAT